MSGFTGLGITANASMVQDRETGKLYALHVGACERAFDAAMSDAGISVLSRFAPMGPTALDSGETCNWGECEVAR